MAIRNAVGTMLVIAIFMAVIFISQVAFFNVIVFWRRPQDFFLLGPKWERLAQRWGWILVATAFYIVVSFSISIFRYIDFPGLGEFAWITVISWSVSTVGLATYGYIRTKRLLERDAFTYEWRCAFGSGHEKRLAQIAAYWVHAGVAQAMLQLWAALGFLYGVAGFMGAESASLNAALSPKPRVGHIFNLYWLAFGVAFLLLFSITLRLVRLAMPHHALASDIKRISLSPAKLNILRPAVFRTGGWRSYRHILGFQLAASLDEYVDGLRRRYAKTQYKQISEFGHRLGDEIRIRSHSIDSDDIYDLRTAALGFLVATDLPRYAEHMDRNFALSVLEPSERPSKFRKVVSGWSEVTVQIQPIIRTIGWIFGIVITLLAARIGGSDLFARLVEQLRFH